MWMSRHNFCKRVSSRVPSVQVLSKSIIPHFIPCIPQTELSYIWLTSALILTSIIDTDDHFPFISLLRGGAWRAGITCITIHNNATDTTYCHRMFYLFLMKKMYQMMLKVNMITYRKLLHQLINWFGISVLFCCQSSMWFIFSRSHLTRFWCSRTFSSCKAKWCSTNNLIPRRDFNIRSKKSRIISSSWNT